MKAIILDVETASLETNEVIQLAWFELSDRRSGDIRFYKPSGKISLGALATHHIIPSVLEGCDPSSKAASDVPACEYVIGHNIDYDAEALGGMTGVKRICTLAMARCVWPDLDCHKLGALPYYVRGANEQTRNLLRDAHNAVVDAKITEYVFHALIADAGLPEGDWEAIYAFSEQARIPKVMTFGKHRGERICDIPADYKRWLLRQDDVCPYLRKALTL